MIFERVRHKPAPECRTANSPNQQQHSKGPQWRTQCKISWSFRCKPIPINGKDVLYNYPGHWYWRPTFSAYLQRTWL